MKFRTKIEISYTKLKFHTKIQIFLLRIPPIEFHDDQDLELDEAIVVPRQQPRDEIKYNIQIRENDSDGKYVY